MADHPSDLRLDLHLAGAAPELAGHLDACPACRARLEGLREAYAAARADPRFEATRAGLPAPAPRADWRRWAPALALPLAAALALALWLRPPPPEGRLKGAPALAVVPLPPAKGPAFRPGDRVELRLGPAGHPYAVVLAVEPGCAVSPLWPPPGPARPLPPGADVPLGQFEVTPGDTRLLALLFDAPADPAALAARARAACGAPPPEGEAGRAEARLSVESGP